MCSWKGGRGPIQNNVVDNEGSHTKSRLFEGILPLRKSDIPRDILAGATLAALAIPVVMGYTRISGTPVITGLFTILFPMALYALVGSSRHLVVGADSATAAVLAAGLVGIAAIGSPSYVAYASVLALMVGIMLIAARLVRLGFLADFLSRTVLVGFLAGVGVQVAIRQLPDMIGIPSQDIGSIQELVTGLAQLSKVNIYSLAISLTVLVVILGVRRISRKIPVALIVVICVIIASYTLNLPSYGVAMIGAIPSGLPKLGFPNAPMSWNILQRLFSTALAMFIIILTQSAATSQAYATRYNESFDENIDLIGLAVANIGAGLSGTFVVNGSPTQTEIVDSAGGRSQLAQLTTVCIVAMVLLFITAPLAYMPIAVLAAIVFIIAVELVNVKRMREIFTQRPSEFWVALATAAIVVLVGVEQGMLLAIALSLIDHTRKGYRPSNSLLSINEEGHWRWVPATARTQFLPGVIVYRFNHSMYYANCEGFKTEVIWLVTGTNPPISWFCFDGSAVDDVDFSAAEALREIHGLLRQRGINLVLVEIQERVWAEFGRYKIIELIGKENEFKTIYDFHTAYNHRQGAFEKSSQGTDDQSSNPGLRS
ncbi:MAG TPA: SulP family inorganic anion transporter [Candidatus Bathyarchaeia archaeon]|nr:SulP family inorganic anion transporter [Candidatus Bathyarchaeia archaeon]